MFTASGHAAASIQVPPAIYQPAYALNSKQLDSYLTGYKVELSDNRPEDSIRIPLAIYELVTPSYGHLDEMLDWNAAIEVAPQRPSGTLSVVLKYEGRGTPTAVEDWD